MEIGSYYNLSLYKSSDGHPTCFCPEFTGKGVDSLEFESIREQYLQYGQEYKGDFRTAYKKLFSLVSFPYLARRGDVTNVDFAHKIFYSNNCYLSFEVCYSEKVVYSVNVKDNCSYVFDSIMIGENSENIFNAVGIFKSFNIFYSRFVFDSTDIRFSSHMIGCRDCVLCDNLQYKSYCIRNQQYTKEEYMKMKKNVLQEKEKFQDHFIQLPSHETLLACEATTGSYLMKSTHLENGMCSYQVKNGRNTLFVGDVKGCENFYDVGSAAYGKDYYGLVGGGLGSKYFCSIEIVGGSNIYYSYFLNDCSYCLGCIGLKNKQYCILNKQYTKEEWFELANKIFENMEKDGTLGSFFPGWMNPFYFNDTAAYLIDDTFTKEEVTAEGYLRRDEEIKVDIPEGADIVVTSDECRVTGEEKLLSDYQGFDEQGERTINPEILKKVICDEKGNHYRIIPMELEFLQKHGLPLPELHWLERIKLGFKFK